MSPPVVLRSLSRHRAARSAVLVLGLMGTPLIAVTARGEPGPSPTNPAQDGASSSATPGLSASVATPTTGSTLGPASSSSPGSGEVTLDKKSAASPNDPRVALGPETASGTGKWPVTPGLEVFAQYAYRSTRAADGSHPWFHQFEATRAHMSLSGSVQGVKGRVVVEGVRSASEGALIGVAGDSMVLRVREAYVGGNIVSWLEARAGIIPTITIPVLERAWGFRAVAPVPLESSLLSTPADAGAALRATLPASLGFVAVAVYNGDGYTNRELNRGKSTEIATEVHPLGSLERAAAPLGLFASYVQGSAGTAKTRADRATGGLLWRDSWLRVGLSYTQAWGVEDSGDRRSWLLDGFVHVELIERLLIGARVTRWQRDTKVSSDHLTAFLGTVGWRVADPLETFVAITRQTSGARAEQSVPGSDITEVRLVGRAVF